MKNCVDNTSPPHQPHDDNEIDRMSLHSERASVAHGRNDSNFMAHGNAQYFGANKLYAKLEHNNLLKNQLRYPAMDKNLLIQRTNSAAKSVNKANSFDTVTLQQHLPFSKYGNETQFAKYPRNFAKFDSDLVAAPHKGSLLKIKESQSFGLNTNEATTMPFIDNNEFGD